MKKTKVFGFALGLVAVIAMVQPAEAKCGPPFLISNTNVDTGVYNYIVNPSVTLGADGFNGSSLTDQFTGFFWAVNNGNPGSGVGVDNGAFAALDWLYTTPGYNAGILTTWAASDSIDGCIDATAAVASDRCQATFMQDADLSNGQGLFALVSTRATSGGDFFLDLDGTNIDLAPMPGMPILSSLRGGATSVTLSLGGPTEAALAAGAYLNPDAVCQGTGGGGTAPLNGLVNGYKVVYQVLPRGSQPPADFDASAWTPAGLPPSALGAPVNVQIGCEGDSDVYISYQLCLDSDFVAPFVSRTTTRTECGPNVAEPEDRMRVAPESRQKPTTRQRAQ